MHRIIDTERVIGDIAEILQTKKRTYEHDSTKTPNISMLRSSTQAIHLTGIHSSTKKEQNTKNTTQSSHE